MSEKTKLIAVPIPEQFEWIATDEDGAVGLHVNEPKPQDPSRHTCGFWGKGGGYLGLHTGDKPKDWRNTLERIVEIEWV